MCSSMARPSAMARVAGVGHEEVPAPEPDDDRREDDVEAEEGDQLELEALHGGDGVRGLEDPLHDPGLAAALRDHPAGLHGHETERGGEQEGAQVELRVP